MKKSLLVLSLAMAAALLVGCAENDAANPNPPPVLKADFVEFLTTLTAKPTAGSPVAINRIEFTNFAFDNPNAFAEVDFGPVPEPPGRSPATIRCRSLPNCTPGLSSP